MNVNEAARRYGLTTKAVYAALQDGRLKARKLGAHWDIQAKDVERYVSRFRRPPGTIGAREASRRLGMTAGGITDAIKRGDLKAELLPGAEKRTGGDRWIIYLDDLEAFNALPTRRPDQVRWNDEMDAALLELLSGPPECTYDQVGTYIGVPVDSVRQRVKRLRKRGIDIRKQASRTKLPFIVPRSAILLAKTCTRCGKLRDRRYYRKHTNSVHNAWCRICHNEQNRGYQRDEDIKARDLARWREINETTRQQATRSGYEWTQAEDDVLADVTKPALVLALELKRSMSAVEHRRARLGIKVRPDPLPDSQWMIDFPAAARVLREHYRAIGPAELYWGIDDGWKDDDVA